MNKPSVGMLCCLAIPLAVCSGLYRVSANPGTTVVPAQDVTPSQTAVRLEPVLTGLTSPVYVTNARDGSGRLFILERAGLIKVLRPGETTPTVFLDITPKVRAGGEQGLLGLAFHPQFAGNGRFFVHYTRRPDTNTNVIAEYRISDADRNVADPDSETVLLTIPQPFANHNGGMIEFGPDGFLYIGKGDGGSANDPGNRAQNIDELLGKILRIDVNHPGGSQPYSSPSDNPFFGPTPGRDEIYALGLRNPWRFSFDRATGGLYVGDVGQNAVEEIDIVARGGNYGWRVFEGTRCTNTDPGLCGAAGFIAPVTEYARAGGRCSVTGGYVYRGTRSSLPAGAYVFGDYCSGEMFLLRGGAQHVLLDTDLNISSFGEDEAGEIYVVGLGGTVHRISNPDPPDARRGTFFADVTGDGRADAIAVNVETVTVRRSDGSRFLPNEDWTQGSYYGQRATLFADVTGDGRADAIVVNDDTVTVRRSDGSRFLPNEDWTQGPYYGRRGTFFADLTGDGRADAVVVNDDTVTVRRSDGTRFLPNEDWTQGAYHGQRGTFFADVTGDGRADATVVNDDTVTVRRSSDFSFLPNEDWTQSPYYGQRATLFADVTGDGGADAIVVNDDTVTVRRSDGSRFLPNEDWTRGPYYGRRGTFFADVTGDGGADAVVVNDDTVTVRRSDGARFLPNEDWTQGPYYGQ